MALIYAVDQGTSSTRVLVFKVSDWSLIAQHQVEFSSLCPEEGWCEQDPLTILQTVKDCILNVSKDLLNRGFSLKDVKAVGITNQRETTVAWNKINGQPLHNAIVWHDARTKKIVDDIIKKHPDKGQDVLREKCGLPISTYFSALKMKWLLDNVEEVKEAADKGQLCFGTIDAWLIWNLSKEKSFVTDVTNASRTMLMNIKSMQWDSGLCDFFGISQACLPQIKSSAEVYGHLGYADCPALTDVPIAGCLGDQQAALVGQKCFAAGMAKNTYGTGCFMLYNVGNDVIYSSHGLLSTVAYKLGPQAATVYALEGSVANCGSAVKWLQSLGMIQSAQESGILAAKVKDTGGVYFVPAFNGLFAPHWRPDARGTMVGLTQYSQREHICRATLEAVAFQVYEILLAMEKESGHQLKALLVDGGMTKNDLLMQTQADFNGIAVVRPKMAETTSLGAALAAAIGTQLWSLNGIDGAANDQSQADIFEPQMKAEIRDSKFQKWSMAVERSLNWVSNDADDA